MKIKHGFLAYLLGFIGLVFGACLVMVCIMMFSPGTSIFGLVYVRQNEEATISDYAEKENQVKINPFNTYKSVTIENIVTDENGHFVSYGDYQIKFTAGMRDATSSNVYIRNHKNGLAKQKEKGKFNVSVTSINGDLTVTIAQYKTWISFGSDCYVEVRIPAALDVSNVKFVAKTGSGSVVFGEQNQKDSQGYNLKANAFEAETTSGGISVSGLASASSQIKLTTVSGSINLSGDTTCSEVFLSSESGRIRGEDMALNSLIIHTTKSQIDLGDIHGNMIINGEKTVARIGKLQGSVNATEDAKIINLKASSVSGDVGIPNGQAVTFETSVVEGNVNIVTEKGSIVVGTNVLSEAKKGILGRADIFTTSGNISVVLSQNNTKLVNLKSTSGKILAYFENGSARRNIITESGDIELNLLHSISTKLICSTEKEISFDWEDKVYSDDIVWTNISGTDGVEGSSIYASSKNGKIKVYRMENFI